MVGKKSDVLLKKKKIYITPLPLVDFLHFVVTEASRHSATKTLSVMLGVQSISCNSGSVISQASVPMQWCVVRVNITKL